MSTTSRARAAPQLVAPASALLKMHQAASQARDTLVTSALQLTHLLAQLLAMYPSGIHAKEASYAVKQ